MGTVVYDGHHARRVSHDVVYFFLVFPSGLLHVHLLTALFCNCVFMILQFFDVASFILVALTETSCRPFWCICLSSNNRIEVQDPIIGSV